MQKIRKTVHDTEIALVRVPHKFKINAKKAQKVAFLRVREEKDRKTSPKL